MSSENQHDISFVAFYLMWADVMGWKVPMLHIRICHWLDICIATERVLMVFRGAAKSTIYAVYKAYRLYKNRSHRSLVWSADGPTAGMLTADVINVLKNHPLTRGMLPPRPGAKRFWVNGARDARNASMRANGVNSNATGARADDVDFDDIEVPGNIETPEARLKLRQRISESTHIAVPGAVKTYIGTPHSHDSIYPERIAAGAEVLKIPLFEHSIRYTETTKKTRYKFAHPVGDDGLYVMSGIHKGARMLREGVDYIFDGKEVIFHSPPNVSIDICSMNAWPERFTRDEVETRRKETLTFNAWDSQYMLEAKPISEIRLDPDKLVPYDVDPKIKIANKVASMWLGDVRIVSSSCRWDPASAKANSDDSTLGLVLQDEFGRRYIHRAISLEGEVAEFSPDGRKIIGGQVMQICDVIKEFHIPRIVIETNGIGGFAASVLKACLKQRHLICGVKEEHSVTNKGMRILEAMEDPLSSNMLWAHTSVIDGPLWDQMKDFNPALKNQADDYIDVVAAAITDTPERLNIKISEVPEANHIQRNWRPNSGTFEVELER